MTNSLETTHIMRSIIYKNIVTRTGKPPICKVCDEVLDVGKKYFRKNTRARKYGSYYCMPCAKEKNLL